MLLADAADVVGGKLYVRGGGWSQRGAPDVPTNMALAIKIDVPWDETNRRHQVVATLITADGEQVELNGEPIRADMEFARDRRLRVEARDRRSAGCADAVPRPRAGRDVSGRR